MIAMSLFLTSCDTNEEIIVPQDDTSLFDVELDVAEGSGTPNETVNVDPAVKSTVKSKITFTSTDLDMKRLYITIDVNGQGEEIFAPTENVDDKADGSIDITTANSKGIEYQFELPVPDTVDNGTVVYKFWATSGKGDFRDIEKRFVAGPGTITLVYGNGTDPAATVKSYTGIQLDAPLGDGTSDTFFSVANGDIYKISEGEEFSAFWDFGYYYLNSTPNAHFSSPSEYRTDVIDIPTVAVTTVDELNSCFFSYSTLSEADFDAITVAGDLDSVTASTEEDLAGIEEGDILEFIDNYGKKGLIKVVEIEPGFNAGDYIIFDLKVQP